jgi:glycosyltransferase involved in cell wall biosynthesis
VTQAGFAIPGDLGLPTGGYMYARRVLKLFPLDGVTLKHIELPGAFPAPSDSDLVETERRLAELPKDAAILFDGLAYGAMPAVVIRRLQQPIVALVHHPLAHETGLPDERVRDLLAREKAALAFARRVIVTSPTTGRTLVQEFGVPAAKIAVAEPGTDPAPRAHGSGPPLQLLAVGSIVPRKAYDILVRALAPLAALDWRLTIAGATDRSSAAVAALRAAIDESGLAARIDVVGPLAPHRLAEAYDRTDLVLMPSLYEGYGMVLSEAMARGLPIVCTTGGAAAETVPDDAAIKVAPGDVAMLSAAVRRVLEDAVLRRRLADASWAAGQSLPRWQDTARMVARVIREAAP